MKQIFTPGDRPMRVAILGSGSYTNGEKLVQYANEVHDRTGKAPYDVVMLGADTKLGAMRAQEISTRYGLPAPEVHFYKDVLRKKGVDPQSQNARHAYFTEVLKSIKTYNPDLIVLAGYMKIVTEPLLSAYAGRMINVHPADLRILRGDGNPRFIGDNAVMDAILAGQKQLRSTVHVVTSEVDGGPILAVSAPMDVGLPATMSLEELAMPKNAEVLAEIVKLNQNALKARGDWKVFPFTVHRIADGSFAFEGSSVFYKGQPKEGGVDLELEGEIAVPA